MRLSLAVILAAAVISVASHPLEPHAGHSHRSVQHVVGHHRRQGPPQPEPQPAPQPESQPGNPPQQPPERAPRHPPEHHHSPGENRSPSSSPPPPQQPQQIPNQPPPAQPVSQPPSQVQPGNVHFEHVEHPGGNPNNIERVTQDTFNDPKNGIHNTVVSHVTMSNNNIRSKPNNKIVQGQRGVVSNGKNNIMLGHGPDNQHGGIIAGNPANVVFVPANTQPPQPGPQH